MQWDSSLVNNRDLIGSTGFNWLIGTTFDWWISDLLASIGLRCHQHPISSARSVRASLKAWGIFLRRLGVIGIDSSRTWLRRGLPVKEVRIFVSISVHVLLLDLDAVTLHLLNWFSNVFGAVAFCLTLTNDEPFFRTQRGRLSFLYLYFGCGFAMLSVSSLNFLHSLLRVEGTTQKCVLWRRCRIWVWLVGLLNLCSSLLHLKKLLLGLTNRDVRGSTNANFSLDCHLIDSLVVVSSPTIFPLLVFNLIWNR